MGLCRLCFQFAFEVEWTTILTISNKSRAVQIYKELAQTYFDYFFVKKTAPITR
jgi:hypothetical protein